MEFKYIIDVTKDKHKEKIREFSQKLWASNTVISSGKTYKVDELDGFVAIYKDNIIGFIAYSIENKDCEIVALYSEVENKGIGTALINKVKELAKTLNCKKLKLITTNDNIRGLEFYQKRGFTISGIKINSIKNIRKIKPIPLFAENSIPIRDEIEFELKL